MLATTLLYLLLLIHIGRKSSAVFSITRCSPTFRPSSSACNRSDVIGDGTVVRDYHLVSRCSQLSVQMKFGKLIDALGTRRSPYANLSYESDSSGAIRIRGSTLKQYLCFSQKGKLISRTNGRSRKCMFREEPYQNYMKIRSEANEHWYVGFNSQGRKLTGFSTKTTWKKHKCFMFTKINLNPRHRKNFNELSFLDHKNILTNLKFPKR